MKKRMIIFNCLLVLLLLTACGTKSGESTVLSAEAAAQQQTTAEENEETLAPAEEDSTEETVGKPEHSGDFDQALVGAWDSVAYSDDGEVALSRGTMWDLCFLPDGTAFYGDFNKFSSGVPAFTEENRIYGLLEYYWQQSVEAGGDTPEPDWELTYEIEDIQESLNDIKDRDVFFQNADNDKLTIHITGTIKTSPVETETIDITITYEKSYPIFSSDKYLEAYLLGNWVDSLGNNWEFYYTEEENAELAYTLTDADGNEHMSDSLFHGFVGDEGYEYFDFYFDDFDMKKYILVSYDEETIRFEHEGTAFSLTREA